MNGLNFDGIEGMSYISNGIEGIDPSNKCYSKNVKVLIKKIVMPIFWHNNF